MAAARKPKSLAAPAEIGVTGLRQAGGYVIEEFLPQLRGQKGMRVYREMADNDPVCGAVLFAVKMLLKQAKLQWQPADDSNDAQEAADFMAGVMDDMSATFADTMDEILTMFEFGFAPVEIVYKMRGGADSTDPQRRSKFSDNLIGVRKLALRAQDTVLRWDFDVDGGIRGLEQQYNSPVLYIPIEKLLLFRTQMVRNNPEGRSILRSAYRPWFFKKRIEEIEGIGVERDLAGYPLLKIPGSLMLDTASQAEKRAYAGYQRFITQLRRDKNEGAILPSDRDANGNPLYELTLLSTGSTRQIKTTEIVDRYDRRIAMTALADFIFLGQQAVGSFALSSDKTEMFSVAIGGWLNAIAGVFNLHLVPRLWALNGFDPAVMPKGSFGDIEAPDLDKLARFIAALAGAGLPLFPDRDLENDLRSKAGLPPAPEDGMTPEQEAEARQAFLPSQGTGADDQTAEEELL